MENKKRQSKGKDYLEALEKIKETPKQIEFKSSYQSAIEMLTGMVEQYAGNEEIVASLQDQIKEVKRLEAEDKAEKE